MEPHNLASSEFAHAKRLDNFYTEKQYSLGRLLYIGRRMVEIVGEKKMHSRGYLDFTMTFMPVLMQVERSGTIANDIAAKLSVSKQAMSKMLKVLENLGYIRTRPHERDRRAQVIELTRTGEECVCDALDCMTEFQGEISDAIGLERLEEMKHGLLALANYLPILMEKYRAETPQSETK